MSQKKITISQQDNYQGKFGLVLRSSALFYYKYDDDFKTTISFLNYWRIKRGIDVAIVANVRSLSGELIRRDQLRFTDGQVHNYVPLVNDTPFEGSVEIEVFALENMVIPYAAIMAVYETSSSISMVHSYSRVYSPHDIEGGHTIPHGEESCWTLRDDGQTRSFAVFHNGSAEQPAQQAMLRVTRYDGQQMEKQIQLPTLNPYATYKLYPSGHIDGLPGFLDGQTANASLSFRVCNAFTRMLVGNENIPANDFQITHSNFNYSRHQTDFLQVPNPIACMTVPNDSFRDPQVLIYPDSNEGEYQVYDGHGLEATFNSGTPLNLQVRSPKLFLKRTDGKLPSRIVTGFSASNDNRLPFECSLGVMHSQRPTKRFWWGSAACDAHRSGSLILHDMPELYGPIKEQTIIVRLYSAANDEYLESSLDAGDLEALHKGIEFSQLFDNAEKHLEGELGYFTLFSQYSGFYCHSSMNLRNGNATLEHAF